MAENRRLSAGRRNSARKERSGNRRFVAVERSERLNVIRELVRWEDVKAEAEFRSEKAVAGAAHERARELVDVLGFDPLTYIPDRSIQDAGEQDDALGRVISHRLRAMLAMLPASTKEIAEATGIRASHVPEYLLPLVDRGELMRTREVNRTTWAVSE